jgi:hypothetical protein
MHATGRLFLLSAVLLAELLAGTACQPIQRVGLARGNPDVVRAAFAKTAAAPTLRTASTLHVGDDLLLDMSSAVHGADFQMTVSGPIVAAFGGVPSEPLEVIRVDGRSFLHNAGVTALTPERWREIAALPLTDPAAQLVTEEVGRALAGGSLITGHLASGPLWCTVYQARPAIAAAVFAAQNAYYEARGRKTKILSGELEFVICDDGYVHRVATTTSNIAIDRPSFDTTVTTEVRLSDFGADIVIELPPHQFNLEARLSYSL